MIYSVLSINKVQVNQDITSYLPADSETRIGLSLMEEQFTTYGSAKVMVSNITYAQAEDLVDDLENIEGVKQIEFDDSKDHLQVRMRCLVWRLTERRMNRSAKMRLRK